MTADERIRAYTTRVACMLFVLFGRGASRTDVSTVLTASGWFTARRAAESKRPRVAKSGLRRLGIATIAIERYVVGAVFPGATPGSDRRCDA